MKTRMTHIALAALSTAAIHNSAHGEEAEKQAEFGYKGGFYLSDGGDNKLTIQGRVQSRFQFEREDAGDNKSAFSIPRARLTLKGNAHQVGLRYKMQTDFGKGSAALKDFYVDYHLSGEFYVRTGQFKKPFARQQLNSSSKLSFVDRTIVDKAFGNGRDIGIEIHNDLGKADGLEWAVGVFNGSGDKGRFSGDVTVDPMTGEGSVSGGGFSNVPSEVRPAVVVRVGHNHGGIKGYSEADLEGGDLRFSVGAAAMMHFGGGDQAAALRAGADFMVKAQGFSVTGGAYISEDGPKTADLSYTGLGVYGQAGYVINKTWQPALRYALLNAKGGAKQHEIAAAFSVFPVGHNFKWQNDIALLMDDNGNTTQDLRARTQLQLTF